MAASLFANFKRLCQLVQPSHNDIGIVTAYTFFIGVLFLAVPLAAQGVVNTIASGMFNQPVIVLSIAVLVGLLFAGILRIFQLQLVEIIQQKIFVSTALNVSRQLLTVSEAAFKQRYAPEVLNRFFDVLTIQKTLAKLLLDGPAAMLQIALGMLLISIYSPWFLLFNLLFIIGIVITLLLGSGAFEKSLTESTAKYRVVQWLQEMGHCRISFKMNGAPVSLIQKTDDFLQDYLKERRQHFSIVLRQSSANFFLEAFASAGVLAIGGYLVLNQQLTLGQLVASEIVILIILSATDKLVSFLESGYDLLTGVDKVYQILELPQERSSGQSLVFSHESASGFHLCCHNLTFGYDPSHPVIKNLSLELMPLSHTSVVGPSGVGKSTLANLICGLYKPQQGYVTLNNVDIQSLQLSQLRQFIAMVGDGHELFEGTVEENILLGRGRSDLRSNALQSAIDIAMLGRDLLQYPLGLQHVITTAGTNISLGQRHRILMARAIVLQPQLLILDEAFTGMDEVTKLQLLENLFNPANPWTILNISHDAEIVRRTDHVYLLKAGEIVESGAPEILARTPDSHFSALFPDLTRRLC